MSLRVVILGSSLTESPPNVKRVVVMLLRILQFPDIQEFLNIILDFITVSDYNNTIETNSLLPPNLMTVLYTQEQKKQVREH